MTILPPELAADFQRRMREIADRPCPPLAATPSTAPPSTAPPPPPRKPEEVPVPPVPEPPAPDGFESILDELGDDVGATKTGLPPRPVQPSGEPPMAPLPPARRDILDGMAPLRAELAAAIAECDPAAFKAAKNRLLEAIGQLLTRFPGNIHLLAERRRIEETQLPRPCPPE